MFALKTRPRAENTRTERDFPRPEARLPLVPKKPVSVEAALDELMTRFPQTLDYLAK